MKTEKINFKPIGKRLVLGLPEVKEKTKGGIIKSPELLKEEKQEVLQDFPVVLAIGDEVTKVKVGDKVLPLVRSIETIKIDGKELGIVEEGWIAGIKTD